MNCLICAVNGVTNKSDKMWEVWGVPTKDGGNEGPLRRGRDKSGEFPVCTYHFNEISKENQAIKEAKDYNGTITTNPFETVREVATDGEY